MSCRERLVGDAGNNCCGGPGLERAGFLHGRRVRQTTDSISHEKRRDSSALLFLTDLRGLDVVLGKLAAHALNLLYAIMAAFPILGLAIGAGRCDRRGILASATRVARHCFPGRRGRIVGQRTFSRRSGGAAARLGSGGSPDAASCPGVPSPPPRRAPSLSPGVLMVSSRTSPTGRIRAASGCRCCRCMPPHGDLLIWAGADRGASTRLQPATASRRYRRKRAGRASRSPSLHLHPPHPRRYLDPGRDPAGWLAWRHRHRPACWWVALLLLPPAAPTSLLWRAWGDDGRRPGGRFRGRVQVLTAPCARRAPGPAASRRMTDLHHRAPSSRCFARRSPPASLALAEWNVLWRAMLAAGGPGLLLALPSCSSTDWVCQRCLAGFGDPFVGIAVDDHGSCSAWLALWSLGCACGVMAVGRTVFWAVLVPWLVSSILLCCSSGLAH